MVKYSILRNLDFVMILRQCQLLKLRENDIVNKSTKMAKTKEIKRKQQISSRQTGNLKTLNNIFKTASIQPFKVIFSLVVD
jgi:hypothetical protein